MRGATAPRLLLELICARVLLPGADHSTDGVMARLDRLERRMTITGGDPSPAPTVPTEPASVKPAPHVVEPTVVQPVRPSAPEQTPGPAATSPQSVAPAAEPPSAEPPAVEPPSAPAAAAETTQPPEPAPTTTTSAGSTLTLVDVRRLWPDIVEATKQRRRLTWIYLTQQAQVVAVDDQTLTLGFANSGARDSFDSGGSAEIVRQAAIDVVGHDWRVETIVDPGANPDAAAPPAERAASPAGQVSRPDASEAPDRTQPSDAEASAAAPELESDPASPVERPSASARQAIATTRGAGSPDDTATPAEPDDGAHPDDTDAESAGLDSTQLLQQALGAQVIEEIPHQ
jgi:DNA polymerase III subunit gamma/tau